MTARVRRNAALLAAFGLALWATGWASVEGLERAGTGRRVTDLDRLDGLLGRVQAVAARDPGAFDVVIVGDSHLMRSEGTAPLHVWLERTLWERRSDAAVWRVAAYGLSLFGHYAISGRIAAAAPDAVVVELNLADLRGGQGVIGIQTSDRNGSVISAIQVLNGDDIMLISDGGTLVRTRVDQVSVMGRNTQGVTLIRLRNKENLVGLARIEEEEESNELSDEGVTAAEDDSE